MTGFMSFDQERIRPRTEIGRALSPEAKECGVLQQKLPHSYLNPKHIPKYTKVKVLVPKINNASAEQLRRATLLLLLLIKSLAAAGLPEYVATHSQLTGYLRPCELDT